MSKRRVVISGMGIVSPVGSTLDSAWDAIQNGRSGISRIEAFDVENYPAKIGGEVSGFDVEKYLNSKESRKLDPFVHLGIAAGMDAIQDSGLNFEGELAERSGLIIGSGIGGLGAIEKNTLILNKNGSPRRISPFFIPGSIINMIAGELSIRYGIKGPNLALVTACTTGTHSIGLATRSIQYGECDVMIAGGAESAMTELGLGGFGAMRALSTRNDDPEAASRPWDAERDGFVMGSGAGILVLEELEHAKKRGAKIYAEVTGFGMSGDAHHMTAPPENGDGAKRCMQAAMRDAGVAPESIDYINAHGTSTPVGDKAETDAVKGAFSEHAYKLAVSSTKSMTGHLLGAAGSVEAIFTALALRDQVAPPTINYANPDPLCDLDYVPNAAR
ncbi:MAG: beta-ketoacyl-ACP synthase II, partial [Gammaproteobacteria bacterium]|nr:beta-ketoacyl-ACP synthase II [Gammaproteobacteria bacterium]